MTSRAETVAERYGESETPRKGRRVHDPHNDHPLALAPPRRSFTPPSPPRPRTPSPLPAVRPRLLGICRRPCARTDATAARRRGRDAFTDRSRTMAGDETVRWARKETNDGPTLATPGPPPRARGMGGGGTQREEGTKPLRAVRPPGRARGEGKRDREDREVEGGVAAGGGGRCPTVAVARRLRPPRPRRVRSARASPARGSVGSRPSTGVRTLQRGASSGTVRRGRTR